MKKHGVEIRRQWEIVFRKLEREEAAAENNNKGDSTGNTNSNSKKRKSKYEVRLKHPQNGRATM